MMGYVYKREITSKCGGERRLCEEEAACHVPPLLRERPLSGASYYDKVFAAAWLDSVNVLLGTKDNKLLLLDTQKDRTWDIGLPRRQCEATVDDATSCGIHSMSLLATGADNPSDAAIFHLPSLEPVKLLKKHDDWIFSMSWLTDSMLATGARDATVRLWSLNRQNFVDEQPIAERRQHRAKVRDMKYCAQSEKLTTLSQDGTCKVWDPHTMQVASSVGLRYKNSLKCLALDYPLLAIGSARVISFVDIRCAHLTTHVKSLDDGWGVNSLSIRGPVVTCGGGRGRISFLDLRSMSYLFLPEFSSYATGRHYFNTGTGVWHSSSNRGCNWQAVYAHSYDVSGTSLLTVGGPILCGQKGSYVAIWMAPASVTEAPVAVFGTISGAIARYILTSTDVCIQLFLTCTHSRFS